MAGSAVLALTISGVLFEALASRIDARHAPGSFVDAGGRRLHFLCIGAGEPTVIFEPASLSRSVSFVDARTVLAQKTRVCSYDRMGTGWSDPGPRETSVGELAEDLRKLQENAPLKPPLVIVASSMGGAVAEMFARRYPDRVAGLVMLDAANSEVVASLDTLVDQSTWTEVSAACTAIELASPFGIVRALAGQPGRWNMLCAVVRGIPASKGEFLQAPPLRRDIPLVVLSAETSDDIIPAGAFVSKTFRAGERAEAMARALRETHKRLAGQSARGSWRVVGGSGHVIASSRPQAVVDAVTAMLKEIRSE